jgi:hypothetical protein
MHIGGDGNAGHRFAGCREIEIFAAGSHLHDNALDVVFFEGGVDDGLDGCDLRVCPPSSEGLAA